MPPSRFILAPIEQVALGAIREERPEVVKALAERLAPVIEELVQSSQGRVANEAEADDLLLQLRDEFVGQSMIDMEPWGKDETLREPVVELLARHLLAEARAGFISRVIIASAAEDAVHVLTGSKRRQLMARLDPVKVDPTHYKVEFENRQVRVLRIRYGPGERSIMHWHPASVGVHLTAANARFTLPGGKTAELRVGAGEVRSYPAGEHLPENLSDQSFELVLIEPKLQAAAKKPVKRRAAAKKRVAKKSTRRR
jgi:quercetin dioxygenase-like cupin family protein